MLDHRGFSAWITTDDLELVEFEPRTNSKDHTVTCWITGAVGKNFIVHWRDHGSNVDSASWIHIDGFKVSGQFLYGHGEELRRGIRVGSEEERPFVFSAIQSDDPSGFNGKPVDKNVGSIVLEIRLVKRVDEREPNPIRAPPNVIRGLRQEGDVAVKYGEAKPTATQKRTWKIEPFDPTAPGPYVTFIFRYRSQEWLISQGIIGDDDVVCRIPDHPPASTLSVADLPPIEITDDEADHLRVPDSPNVLHSPVPPPAPSPIPDPVADSEPEEAPSPRVPSESVSMFDGLGLGHPGPHPTVLPLSRDPSTSSARSWSGTWDSAPAFNQEYEEWKEYEPDEYRSEDLNDAIDDYYH